MAGQRSQIAEAAERSGDGSGQGFAQGAVRSLAGTNAVLLAQVFDANDGLHCYGL